jgi:hypothetical protein
MCRRRARLDLSAEDVGLRSKGLFLILLLKISAAVSGELARARSACAGWVGAFCGTLVRGDEVMVVGR